MDMSERVEKLEAMAADTSQRLTVLERDVATIKANGATKADIAELRAESKCQIAELKSELMTAIEQSKSSLVFWVVGSVFLAQILPRLLERLGL